MRVLILGAGFGGLELSTCLTESLGDDVEVTLIDKNDSFVFGYSKLDVIFGRAEPDSIHLSYSEIANPRVQFKHETITSIDPDRKQATTTDGTYTADVMIVALGADYDLGATPGVRDGEHEFYSVSGAKRLREVLSEFSGGTAVVAVTTPHFKCPPAPCEAAMLLHEYLAKRGLSEVSRVVMVTPWGIPIPVSTDTSSAILNQFEAAGIEFMGDATISTIDTGNRVVQIADGRSVAYDLLMAVPIHKAPSVVVESGMTVDGWIPVEQSTLATRYPGVYALGDVASVGVPRAGVFSEGQARTVANQIIAQFRQNDMPGPYLGMGTCYVEMGQKGVGRVDVNFLGGPKPTASFSTPTPGIAAEKVAFEASRKQRWFG